MANDPFDYPTAATVSAVVIGLAITQDLSANDQNIVANLLFAAAQAISTRASLMTSDDDSDASSSTAINSPR